MHSLKIKYKQVIEILNKDVHDPKLTNMAGIITCLMSNISAQNWIVDSNASHQIGIYY